MDQYRRALESHSEDDCMHALMELAYIEEPWADELIVGSVGTEFQGVRSFLADIIIERHTPDMLCKIADFLSSDRIETRNFAGKLLVTIGEDSFEALTKVLLQKSHAVRQFAVDCIREIGDVPQNVADGLLQRLQDPDENVNVKYSVCETLAQLGNPEHSSILRSFIHDPDIGYMALFAVGMIEKESGIAFLMDQYSHGDELYKFAVLDVLGHIHCRQVREELYTLLAKEQGYLTHIICRAIAESMLPGEKIEAHPDVFVETLTDDDCIVRRSVAKAMAYDGRTEFVDAIARCLDDACIDLRDEVFEIFRSQRCVLGNRALALYDTFGVEGRKNILSLIGELNLQEYEKVIINGLHDSSSEIRELAAFAYGKFSGVQRIDELRTLAAQESVVEVQVAFIRALGWHRDEGSVRLLLDMFIRAEDPIVHDAVMGSMIIIGGQEVIDALTELLQEGNLSHQARSSVISALGWIGEIEVIPALRPFIDDEDPLIREKVITTVARLNAAEFTDLIVASLNDEVSSVREAAFEALWYFGDSRLLEFTKVMLHDEEAWLRYKAFKKLAQFLPDSSLEDFLIHTFYNAEGLDRIAVIQTLSKSSMSSAICDIIRMLLTHDDRDLIVEALSIIEARKPTGFIDDINGLIARQSDPFIRKKAETIKKQYGG